jgi:signal transduction histidine kinase
MQHIYNNYWTLITLLIATTSSIVLFYGFAIYKAIREYNLRSLTIQKDLEELKSKQEKLLLQTELEIQEQTFKFISMEIHDNITQVLSLAKLHLNCLELYKNLENQERLTKSKELISKSLDDLSNLSKSMDSDLIENHGLVAAIRYEIDRWKRFTDDSINLEIIGNVKFFNHKNDVLIFRIIQEAVNNIIKYAQASTITIRLEQDSNSHKISIFDNGLGFDIEKVYENKKIGKMSGLKNMRLRAEILNGTLNIYTNPGKGSLVEAIIPITSNTISNDKNSSSRRSQTIA